jgi:hypothetical protein
MSFHNVRFARSRRDFLRYSSCGFGAMALSALCQGATSAAAGPLAPKPPHFQPRAKRVIFLFMAGGPSHMDMFDYKPRLAREDGNKFPMSMGRLANAPGMGASVVMGPVSTFSRQGKAGFLMSEYLPHLGKLTHELALLSGMQADSEAHALRSPCPGDPPTPHRT